MTQQEVGVDAVVDTIPLRPREGDFLTSGRSNPFDLQDPAVVKQEVTYDPETGYYILTEKVGDQHYRPATYLTAEEYVEWKNKAQQEAYFDNLSGVHNDFITFSEVEDPIEQFDISNDLLNRLFGGTEISVQPKGNIDLTLGGTYQAVLNPNLPVRQQRRFFPDFDMDINMGLNAKIGEKLDLNFDYNSNATFNFENRFQLKFDTDAFSEDDIIKSIEAGDVALPLKSSLIQGNQSLFGLKTKLQFGKLFLTTVVSQQRSEQKNIRVQNGAQWQEFEIKSDNYDEDRHFLMSHYNRATFESAMANLPQFRSLFRITRSEVWVTSINNEFQDLRQIVALTDLGEADVFTNDDVEMRFRIPTMMQPDSLRDIEGSLVIPDNNANGIYQALIAQSDTAREIEQIKNTLEGPNFGMINQQDFEIRRARKLDPSRYTIIPELGVISLDGQVQPDEVLAVAYEFTYDGRNFQVGEFSSDAPSFSGDTSRPSNQVLFVKMLKSSLQRVDIPLFDLMMKNVYAIGAYQASEEDFQFDIYYDDPGSGVKRFLPENAPHNQAFLSAFGLDQLNFYGDPAPDGFFDFIPGATINTRTGKVMFPTLEPFGPGLRRIGASSGDPLPDELYDQYNYDSLYVLSKFRAQEYQERNRFVLKGSYKSSVSNEISLGAFNLPEGSVTVRSGGVTLRENIDYVVDYNIGRVTITNDAYLSSGAPIDVSFEDRTLFGLNRQSMLGLRADYVVNDKINIGGTFMKLWERPFTPKVNFGNDPINNNIYGLDFAYSDRAPWLTKAVDALPFLSTSEESSVDLYLEGALLRPGHPKVINVGDDEGGVVFIDDFEGSRTAILLNAQLDRWKLASVPQSNPRFPMGNDPNFAQSIVSGANRAKMNWYRIQQNVTINQNELYEKFFRPSDIFPGTPFADNFVDFRTLDLQYYPNLPGQYNFDPPEGTANSAGLLGCGETGSVIELRDPGSRWAGIMRDIDATNFEAANVQALEFWVLNPFADDPNPDGDRGELVFHIGNISEDILRDDRVFYENALPVPGDEIQMDTTIYSRVSPVPPVIFAFSNDAAIRPLQDLGLDGFDDAGELEQFAGYVQELQDAFPSSCVNRSLFDSAAMEIDVSRDNYIWFADGFWEAQDPIARRFSRFNGLQGNSPIVTGAEQFSPSFTIRPDAEDINYDGTSETAESYFEYAIPLISTNQQVDTTAEAVRRYVTDIVDNTDQTPGEIWYRFKIPLNDETLRTTFGSIQDFRAIKYVRMMVRRFETQKTFRFARLEFTRNQWRIVDQDIDTFPGSRECQFDINTVNIEENGLRQPFNYILPPGIDREANVQSAFRGQFLNEQSLSLEMCNCPSGELRAVFKQVGMNMREFERLKLFTHAEADNPLVEDGHFSLVLRLGSDFTNNYYEHIIPLDMSELGEDGADPDVIWKPDNRIDLLLQELVELKKRRTGLLTEKFTEPYAQGLGEISVLGSPNLADVFNVFIGIQVNRTVNDYCAEFWLNELRLTGLSNRGGAAAVGRVDMQLADLGNLALSGSISSIGWGAIDQQLLERSQEKIVTYDAATNLELSRFLGKESKLQIPFFAQISNERRTPRYDPYDRDLTAEDRLNQTDDSSERDSIREAIQTRSAIRTISFNNVRKLPKDNKKVNLPWDVSNFAVSYTNTTTERSDPILSKDDSKHETGVLNYQYNTGSKPIEPFKKLIKTDKWIRFLKDFNFNPLPTSISARSVLDRRSRERQFRLIGEGEELATATSRQFLWNRDYRLSWDLTRSLRFNYTAANIAAVDELDNDGNPVDPADRNTGIIYDRNEYLWDNLREFGRNKQFDQNLDASYKLPFDKFGILDWISTDVQYGASYSWTRAALNVDSLGNSISNNINGSLRVNLNFEKLYDKSGYLKQINRSGSRGRRQARRPSRSGDDDKKEVKAPGKLAKAVLRPLMMIRRLRFNYTEQQSSFVPGLNVEPSLLGLSSGFGEPGWEYVLGLNPDDQWLIDRRDRGLFTDNVWVNQEVNRSYNERWEAQLAIEPVRDFKIDVNMNRSFQTQESFLFKNLGLDRGFNFGQRREFGSYTISYVAPNTMFQDGEENIANLFENFKENLEIVSERLSSLNPDAPVPDDHLEYEGFKYGYGLGQQEVIIPAFLAAYTNQNANDVDLNLFDQFPRPNWTLTFTGLTKIPWFKERFTRLSLTHGYNGTLSTNSFRSDLRFQEGANQFSNSNLNPITGDFYARLNIPQVVISESLSPLVRFDMETVSGLSLNFEVQKNRVLALDTDNQQLNETRATNWVAGFGYALSDVYLGFIPGSKKKDTSRKKRQPNNNNQQQPGAGNQQNVGGELRINCDFSLRDDLTIQHLWGIDVTNRPTRGQRVLSISPAIDYVANKYLTMRLFADYRSTRPATDQSFPITNIRGGLRMSFTLQ